MNRKEPPRFDHREEHEWLAQERALHDERLHATDRSDPLVVRYRVVVRALRQPLAQALPDDFAAKMAWKMSMCKPADVRVEDRLLQGLMLTLALAIAVVMVIYGGDTWQALRAPWPSTSATAMQWIMALAACLGMTGLLGVWRYPFGVRGPQHSNF